MVRSPRSASRYWVPLFSFDVARTWLHAKGLISVAKNAFGHHGFQHEGGDDA